MTNDDQYVPSEVLLRIAWSDYCQSMDACNAWVRPDDVDPRAEFDRFLAHVRRDAAREALNGLARAMMDTPGIGPGTKTHRARMRVDVVTYRDAHYP